MAIEPLLIGVLRRQLTLDLLVVHDTALDRIDQEDLARVQALLDQHVLRRHVEHADFGGHDDQVVLGDVVARRSQTVAIEHRADQPAVGERNRRRSIPRLHQRRVVVVERLAFRAHGLVIAPWLGDHHQQRVRQRAAGHHQQFEHVVERRSVAAAFADDRQELAQVVAEEIALEQPFASAHPVDVAAQRVDLAVVRDEPVGMRERPRRERVGAEPLMNQRERRLQILVGEIREHRRDLLGLQHPLVDQPLRRQADDVEEAARQRVDLQRIDGMLDPLADHVQRALRLRAARSACARRASADRSADTSSPVAADTSMKTCSKTGCVALALSPIRLLSLGTSRQPSSADPLRP